MKILEEDTEKANPSGISTKIKVFKQWVDKKHVTHYIMAKKRLKCRAIVDFTAWEKGFQYKQIFMAASGKIEVKL
jgi:hypothetical protein